MTDTKIICIGSPFGDDQFGAWVYEQLQGRWPVEEVALRYLDRPGMRLTHLLAETRQVILIDAVKSGSVIGTVLRIDGDEIVRHLARHTSTHGFGIAEALALAQRLGQAPPRLVLLGVEAGATDAAAVLSEAMREALPKLIAALEMEIVSSKDAGASMQVLGCVQNADP